MLLPTPPNPALRLRRALQSRRLRLEEVTALGAVAVAPLLLLRSFTRPLAETPRRQDASNYDKGGRVEEY